MKSFFMLSTLIFLAVMTGGCGMMYGLTTGPRQCRDKVECTDSGLEAKIPKKFAVYPFKNTSRDVEAAQRARRSMQSELVLIGEVVPLGNVTKAAGEFYTVGDAVRTGREVGADAVVMGEVTDQTHYWALVYATARAELKIQIYDTATGKCIWQGQKSDFMADICNPFTLFISPIHENTQWNSRIEDVYHRIASDMIYSIRPNVYSNKVVPSTKEAPVMQVQ